MSGCLCHDAMKIGVGLMMVIGCGGVGVCLNMSCA